MSNPASVLPRSTFIDRIASRAFGALSQVGLRTSPGYLVEVRARSSGRLYSIPVELVTQHGRCFLVVPRGYTKWVRSAEANGEILVRKGRRASVCRLVAVSAAEKPLLLKRYLDRFRRDAQRFFAVPAGSPVDAFVPLTGHYPVFELLRDH